MLCKSMSFCPSCAQCPQCCRRTDCRGTFTTVLAYLARNGCESSSGFSTEGWLFPPFQSEAPLDKGSFGSQWLRKSYQKPLPQRVSARSHRETGSRKGGYQVVSGFLQPAVSCPQTEQKVEANLRSEPVKSVFEGQFIQDGNSGDDSVILTNRGMGNLAGLQRRILPHSNQQEVKKVFKVLSEQTNFPIHSSPFWFGHSSPRIYKGGQRSETDGTGQGYPDPPVPRRLVAESPVPGNLPTRYPDPLGPVPKVRLGSQHEEIRIGSDCSCCNGQYNSGLLHQQAGRYEVRLSVYPPLEAPILVPSQGNCPEGQTHSRSLECDSGQAFQTQSSDPNRVVPISAGVQSFVFQMGPIANRLVCNPVQSQTSSVCITGTGSDSLGSGRPQSPMGKFGRVCLSTSLPGSPGGGQNDRSGLSEDDSHCSRLAKHALVLGPGEFVGSDSLHSSASKGPGDSAVQRTSSQEPQQSKPACVAPRASAIHKQGFSDEVAERIEAPQRVSTRAMYNFCGVSHTRWTSGRPL